MASPIILDLPVLGGWYDVLCTYSCVLTSSISACRKREPLHAVTSRKTFLVTAFMSELNGPMEGVDIFYVPFEFRF